MFSIQNQLRSYDYDNPIQIDKDEEIKETIRKGLVYYDPFDKLLSITNKGRKYMTTHNII